ncbi:MAG: ABC transporter ATP-binding protein [Opitutae bacterium]|nr:ABC transporter ATP-binding protein [Opitutae bacterium]MEC8420619.1 ABC transporter ATP-binding protein [Verrucomicrobiota bacterium]
MKNLVSIQKISKTYSQGGKRIEVLFKLSLEVKKGETLAILGQSGSGKSTLLSLISGLDQPDYGNIRINDCDLTKMKQEELARFRSEQLGIVFQQYHLLSNLTALENVTLPLELQHRAKVDDEARKALAMVGLSNRLSHFPSELSGGECQRVALARAMITRPSLILADEPSGNLDSNTGREIMELLFKLCKEREQTLILVTHNRDLASLCDRSLTLREGRLFSSDS